MMSEAQKPEQPNFPDDVSPEELEAALAANEADSQQALAQMQGELAALEAKNAELADQYLRAQADVLNARKRADDEISKARKFAVEAFAESLLPVTDSLEAGLAVQGDTAARLREGMELTLRQLLKVAGDNGLVAINPAGEPFNPEHHQAMSMVPAPGVAPNHVVQVYQKGWLLNERLLRPALVVVAQDH